MKKRIIALLLCGGVFMTGCGGSGESSETTQSVSTDAAVSQQTTSAPEVVSSDTEQTTTSAATTKSAETSESESDDSQSDGDDIVIELEDTYAELITQYDNAFLGLPRKDKIYIFKGTGAVKEINGIDHNCVSCYDEHEGTLYFMCDYYISDDGSSVYRYYVSDDSYVCLPESAVYSQVDPTVQSAEEIFEVANRLYGYFALTGLECDPEQYFEADMDGTAVKYYKVINEALDTKAELLSALSCYFSADIINSLMDTPNYREGTDGKLYTLDAARGSNIEYKGTIYEISLMTEDMVAFTAYSTYGFEDSEPYIEEYVYNMIKQDGRWVFTNFQLPY